MFDELENNEYVKDEIVRPENIELQISDFSGNILVEKSTQNRSKLRHIVSKLKPFETATVLTNHVKVAALDGSISPYIAEYKEVDGKTSFKPVALTK